MKGQSQLPCHLCDSVIREEHSERIHLPCLKLQGSDNVTCGYKERPFAILSLRMHDDTLVNTISHLLASLEIVTNSGSRSQRGE